MTRVNTRSATVPRVRVVVVNYDGGDMTMRCLESLRRLDWPSEALEVVLVDNASIDGLVDRVRRELPEVRVIESMINTGFAGGCDQGMEGLSGLDYVALLNNDAIADRNWLRPLVETLEADPAAGAANSKILLADTFVGLSLGTTTFQPPAGDDRPGLGVRISGLEVDGRDMFAGSTFADAYGVESGNPIEGPFRWTAEACTIQIPVDRASPAPRVARLRLAAEAPKTVTIDADGDSCVVKVDTEPAWYDTPRLGKPFDVVNNAGSVLVDGGYGADRGFLERDEGQYDEPVEVFAWCGAAVLLSCRYLRDVGSFDERFFLYYEDTDLSWRGRLAGWHYRYVPTSLVRHEHAATSIEGSSVFNHYVDRNRLLMLARNAPWPLFRHALGAYVREMAWLARRDVVAPLRDRRRPTPGTLRQKTRSLAGFTKLLPTTLASRRKVRGHRKVDDAAILAWMVDR